MRIQRPEIIATLNVPRAGVGTVAGYVEAGATCLRLNGVFVETEALAATVRRVRHVCGDRVRIVLDLPGFKLRVLHLTTPVRFMRGVPFALRREWLNFPDAFDLLRAGMLLRIADGRIELSVVGTSAVEAMVVASRAGVLLPGKGIHIERVSYRPEPTALSSIDRDLIAAAIAHDIDAVGLSFASRAADVLHVQDLCRGSRTVVIPKIESKESVKRIGEIVELADEVIIDRGDLAAEIGLHHVWRAQREIIGACRRLGTRVYAATQLLSSMVRHPLPSIAEIDSLYSLIHEGIDGVQLSEETSVGRYGAEAIRVARRTLDECERARPALVEAV